MDASGNTSANSPAWWLWLILISSEMNPCHKAGGKITQSLVILVLYWTALHLSAVYQPWWFTWLMHEPWDAVLPHHQAAWTTSSAKGRALKKAACRECFLPFAKTTLRGGSFRSAYSTVKEETALPSDTWASCGPRDKCTALAGEGSDCCCCTPLCSHSPACQCPQALTNCTLEGSNPHPSPCGPRSCHQTAQGSEVESVRSPVLSTWVMLGAKKVIEGVRSPTAAN